MHIKKYASILHEIKNSGNFNEEKSPSFQRFRYFIRSLFDVHQDDVHLGGREFGLKEPEKNLRGLLNLTNAVEIFLSLLTLLR